MKNIIGEDILPVPYTATVNKQEEKPWKNDLVCVIFEIDFRHAWILDWKHEASFLVQTHGMTLMVAFR